MKNKSIIILILTYIPIIMGLVLQGLYFSFFVNFLNQKNLGSMQNYYFMYNIISVIISICILIILIYYIIHIVKNNVIVKKSSWIVLVLLFNVIPMTIYWYKYINKKE